MVKKTSDSLKQFSELLLALTQKEIKARYKHTVLGILWLFINPLIQMVVIGLVFSLIFKFGIKDYYQFLFVGLLPWNFFSLSINKATPSIVYARDLINKSSFPREVIPLSIVLSHFIYFFISLIVLSLFLVIVGRDIIHLLNIIPLLTGLFLILIFSAGISLLTSALTVFYRDINFVTQAIILVWFYLTPIIYPLSLIPERARAYFVLNPLSGIIALFQFSLLGSGSINLPSLIFQIIIILLVFLIGFFIFRKHSASFTDWL